MLLQLWPILNSRYNIHCIALQISSRPITNNFSPPQRPWKRARRPSKMSVNEVLETFVPTVDRAAAVDKRRVRKSQSYLRKQVITKYTEPDGSPRISVKEEVDEIMFSDSSLEDRLSNHHDNQSSSPDNHGRNHDNSSPRGADSTSPQSFRSVTFADGPATPRNHAGSSPDNQGRNHDNSSPRSFFVRGATRVSPQPPREGTPLSEKLAQLEEWMF